MNAAPPESAPRSRARRAARAALPYLPAVAAGLLLRGAFPPFEGQASIAFFAPAAPLLAARLLAPRRAALFGWVWGFAFFSSALSWFAPLSRNGGPWPLVLLGVVGLAGWCALFPALACAALSRAWWAPWREGRRLARAARERFVAAREGSPEEEEAEEDLARLRRRALRREVPGPLAAALLWAGAETLRATVAGGFAWYSLGASQLRLGPLAQLAALGGTPLVSAAVALLADAVAGVLLRAYDAVRRTPGATRRHLDLTLALALLLAAFCWGARHARALRAAWGAAPAAASLAAVDPDLPCIFTERNDGEWKEGYNRLVERSLLAGSLRPDAILWPETSLWSSLPDAPTEAALRRYVRAFGAPVLAGSTLLGPGGAAEPVRNAAWLFSEDGASAPYVKRHLVPFGEFIPLDETIPALRRLAPAGVTCAAGEGPVLLDLPLRRGGTARLSPLICFEDTVPATTRASARDADILVSISNDAWFDGSCEALQHHAEAAFRAIENGLPLVRASNRGVCAVIRPWGESGEDAGGGFFVESVPVLPERPVPPYARFGDALFGLPCAALLLLALLPVRRLRRASPPSAPPSSSSTSSTPSTSSTSSTPESPNHP